MVCFVIVNYDQRTNYCLNGDVSDGAGVVSGGSMNEASTEVIHLYESCGMTVSQIAEECNLEESAVKGLLSNYSTKFKQEASKAEEEISSSEKQEFVEVIKSLARCAENEQIKMKCAMWLVDERKGRNDAKVKMLSRLASGGNGAVNINILTLNDQLKKAREAIDFSKAIDIKAA